MDSPYIRRVDGDDDDECDGGGGRGGSGEMGRSSDAFDIPAKNAPLERLKRWRQAALVLNASRRFRYTLDLKKEEEKEQIRRKIRAHAQVIRAAFLFKEAGERHVSEPQEPPVVTPGFGIGQEQLTSMTRDHNYSALQEYGGVKGIGNLLKTNFEKGLSGDDEDLLNRRNVLGANRYPRKKGRSFLGIKDGWYDGGSIAFAVFLVIFVTGVPTASAVFSSRGLPTTSSPPAS